MIFVLTLGSLWVAYLIDNAGVANWFATSVSSLVEVLFSRVYRAWFVLLVWLHKAAAQSVFDDGRMRECKTSQPVLRDAESSP